MIWRARFHRNLKFIPTSASVAASKVYNISPCSATTEFTLIFTLRASCPDQKLFAGSSSSRQTGVTSRDAVFGVVVRYPFVRCWNFAFGCVKKSSSSPFGGMLKSSFRQISSYLIAISRKNQARCEPKRRPSQTEPMRKLVLVRIVRLQRAYQALRATSNRYIWASSSRSSP